MPRLADSTLRRGSGLTCLRKPRQGDRPGNIRYCAYDVYRNCIQGNPWAGDSLLRGSRSRTPVSVGARKPRLPAACARRRLRAHQGSLAASRHCLQLLGNCSCVVLHKDVQMPRAQDALERPLDGRSRRRSTASIHGCVPPASMQSSCVVGIQSIHGHMPTTARQLLLRCRHTVHPWT